MKVEEAQIKAIMKHSMGMNCLQSNWECPICKRSTLHTVRLTKKYTWVFELNLHHDHAAKFCNTEPRFADILICGDCNRVDARVKASYKCISSDCWSFSPDEIAKVITVVNNRYHRINFDLAFKMGLKLYSFYKNPKVKGALKDE